MAVAPKSKFSKSEIDLIPQFGKLMEEFLPSPGSPVIRTLEEFGTRQLERMDVALGISGRVASKRLQQSLTFEDIEFTKEGVTMNWGGEDYARFVDEGVNGMPGAKGSRDFGSPYSFRAVRRSSTFQGLTFYQSMREWLKFKNIKTMTVKGPDGTPQIKNLKTESDYNGLAYVLMMAVKRKGIEPSYFISDSFEDGKVMEEIDKKLQEVWQSL
jgi:hypothetical protein